MFSNLPDQTFQDRVGDREIAGKFLVRRDTPRIKLRTLPCLFNRDGEKEVSSVGEQHDKEKEGMLNIYSDHLNGI